MEEVKDKESEVKILNRTQKHQLRSILLGRGATLHGHGHGRASLSSIFGSESNCTPPGDMSTNLNNCSNLSSSIPLGIWNYSELTEKALRVADEEIESLKKQRLDHIFADGEEKLLDLQQSLLKVASVPVPKVELIEEERYNGLYPVLRKGSFEHPFIRTTGPPPPCDSVSGSSGGEEGDFEYDLDDEDNEFLTRKRKQDQSFAVTDTLFEGVVTWFLSHKMKTAQDFVQLKRELDPLGQAPATPLPEEAVPSPIGDTSLPPALPRPYRPYPLALLAPPELDSVINYFLEKEKTAEASVSGTLPAIWQPTHVSASHFGHRRKSLSSPASTSNKKQRFSLIPTSPDSAYKIFRPATQMEPKVLRSHTKHAGLNWIEIHKLKSKARCLRGFTAHFKAVMRYHFHTGLQHRKQTIHNLKALEEAWALDDDEEDALSKFVFRKKNVVQVEVDNNNNESGGGGDAQNVVVQEVVNDVGGISAQIQTIQCSQNCSTASNEGTDGPQRPSQHHQMNGVPKDVPRKLIILLRRADDL